MIALAQQAAAGAAVAIQKPVETVTKAFASEVDGGRAMVDVALRWLAENGASFVVSLLVVALLLLFGARAIRMVTFSTRHALQKTGRVNALLETFICSVVHKTCWALLLMVVVQRLGINIAPLIAGLGVTGFILGFAFQETLGNLAAGMMIATNKPIEGEALADVQTKLKLGPDDPIDPQRLGKLFAASLGFHERQFFDLGEERKTVGEAPQVKF